MYYTCYEICNIHRNTCCDDDPYSWMWRDDCWSTLQDHLSYNVDISYLPGRRSAWEKNYARGLGRDPDRGPLCTKLDQLRALNYPITFGLLRCLK